MEASKALAVAPILLLCLVPAVAAVADTPAMSTTPTTAPVTTVVWIEPDPVSPALVKPTPNSAPTMPNHTPAPTVDAAVSAPTGDAFQHADRELNAAWNKLLAGVGPVEKVKLVKAQRLWIRYRDADAECTPGGAASPVAAQRRTEITRLRTKELDTIRLALAGTEFPGMEDPFAEYRKADERLNTLWSGALRGASAASREKLVKAQRLWIEFRDASCSCVTDDQESGPYTWWLLRMTSERSDLLLSLGSE
jgi:uncharacterized protein YecT (DUF1311 family)